MHIVGTGDVGKLENLFIAEMLLKCLKRSVRYSTARQDQIVRIGKHNSFYLREQRGARPTRNGFNLLIAKPHGAERFAMLGEHKLATPSIARSSLTQLSQTRTNLAIFASIKLEPFNNVLVTVWHCGKHCPPVSRCACCRARLLHWISIRSKQQVVQRQNRIISF